MAKFVLQPDPNELRDISSLYIKDFYLDRYSDDELGFDLADDVTFANILEALNDGIDVYDVMGAGDSVIRERIFQELSELLHVDYDVIYDLWLKG